MSAIAMEGSMPYPVRFDVPYPETLNRWLIFVKWLLSIPHYVIVYLLGYALAVTGLITFFVVLFTAKYPQGLFKFNVGVMRWQANYYAYVGLLRDEYPPFSMDAGMYPLTLDISYPEDLNRWMVLVKWLLAIPHLVVLAVLGIAAIVVSIVAWFVILFTGKYPRGIFDFVVGVMRWSARVNAYMYFMTDRYPPFSLEA